MKYRRIFTILGYGAVAVLIFAFVSKAAPLRLGSTWESECGNGCTESTAREIYSEYVEDAYKEAKFFGEGERTSEILELANGTEAPGAADRMLSFFLGQGFGIRSQDMSKWDMNPPTPGAFLSSGPGFTGNVVQIPNFSRDFTFVSAIIGPDSYLIARSKYHPEQVRGLYQKTWSSPDPLAGPFILGRTAVGPGGGPLYTIPISADDVKRNGDTTTVGYFVAAPLNGDSGMVDVQVAADFDQSCAGALPLPCPIVKPPVTGTPYPMRPVSGTNTSSCPAAQVSWQHTFPMQVMINASYFNPCASGYYQYCCGYPSGVLVQNGQVLLQPNTPDYQKNGPLDAFLFTTDGKAYIVANAEIQSYLDKKNVQTAIGGNIVVMNGAPVKCSGPATCCPNCHDMDETEGRAAIAIDQYDNLMLIVVQTGCKEAGPTCPQVGVTGYEFVQFLLSENIGAQQALMLDGGGSAEFSYLGPGSEVHTPPADMNGSATRPIPVAIGIRGRK